MFFLLFRGFCRRIKFYVIQLFDTLFVVGGIADLLNHRDNGAEGEERTGGRYDDHNGRVVTAEDVDAHKGARADDLTNGGYHKKGKGEAKTHGKTVDGGGQYLVLGGKRLGARQDDTVDNDEGNEKSQGLIQGIEIGTHQKLDGSDKARDDDDVRGDTNLLGNKLAQKGDKDVGANEHRGCRKSHTDGVVHRRGGGKGRAHSEELNKNGVVVKNTALELTEKACFFHGGTPFS